MVFLLLEILSTSVFSAEILIISSSPSKTYANVTRSLVKTFDELCQSKVRNKCSSKDILEIQYKQLDSISIEPTDFKYIVTLGRTAAIKLQKSNLAIPQIYALISKRVYESQLKPYASVKHSAIFLDQKLVRNLYLSKIVKENARLGVLLSKSDQHKRSELEQLGLKLGLKIYFQIVEDDSTLGLDLKALMQDSNLLLALPDARIYNKETIFNILLSSYHNQTPLIGFSAAYVKAGAIAAIYSSPQQIGTHLGELLYGVVAARSEDLPESSHAKYFSISVNRGVAKSLDISLPSEENILQTIEEAEK